MAGPAIAFAALAGFQIVGGYFAAQNIKETARLNREIAEMNAEFAELDAYEAEIEGYNEATRYQGIVDNVLSKQRTEMAAADIDVNYGSASTIEDETRFLAEVNKLEIIHHAEDKVLGFEREARNLRFGGYLDYAQSRSKLMYTKTSAISDALRSGISGYRSYRRGE